MSLCWLHVSDFHFKTGDPYDRDVVLNALVRSVEDFRRKGQWRDDLVFATGDIAHSGQPREYELATEFFDTLCQAADLSRRQLFVIPGNHDVNRELAIGLARTLSSREEADNYFSVTTPKPHITQKLNAFAAMVRQFFC